MTSLMTTIDQRPLHAIPLHPWLDTETENERDLKL